MKFLLKSALVLFATFLAIESFSIEEASAQGPIIRRMRERLNGGKPLLPFVEDIEQASRDAFNKRPTPATKLRPSSAKTPTPAKAPTPARTRTPEKKEPTLADRNPSKDRPTIKLASPGRGPSASKPSEGATGFGMRLKEVRENFYVDQIDPRGNAAEAGLRRGDLIEEIGGAPIKVIEEFDAIAKAMRGGDRVEFKISRRGSKPEKVVVQYGQPDPVDESEQSAQSDQSEEPNRFNVAPRGLESRPSANRRTLSDRYEPTIGSGLNSIYDGAEKPSSILEPTPAPRPANRIQQNRIQPLELDLPALDGGK